MASAPFSKLPNVRWSDSPSEFAYVGPVAVKPMPAVRKNRERPQRRRWGRSWSRFYRPVDEPVPDTPPLLMEPGAPEPMPVVLPTALLGGPISVRFAGESPSLGPLFPVVLPLSELPVVVELAAGPPEAELPPAEAPALVPGLCAWALKPRTLKAAANINIFGFIALFSLLRRQHKCALLRLVG
jgi:hypothetical protein